MPTSSSTYRCKVNGAFDKWVTSACYAGVRYQPYATEVEAPFVFWTNDLSKEMCDWWYDEFIASCAPAEIKEFWQYTDTVYGPMGGTPYRTILIDLTRMTWDDAIILLTMCRMIQEYPQCVKLAHEIYHGFKPAISLDTAVYFGMTYPTNTNSNHMPTGNGLHTFSWIDERVLTYSFKERWKNYGGQPKRLLATNKGNSVNGAFHIPRGTAAPRRDKEAKTEFLNYLKEKCLTI